MRVTMISSQVPRCGELEDQGWTDDAPRRIRAWHTVLQAVRSSEVPRLAQPELLSCRRVGVVSIQCDGGRANWPLRVQAHPPWRWVEGNLERFPCTLEQACEQGIQLWGLVVVDGG